VRQEEGAIAVNNATPDAGPDRDAPPSDGSAPKEDRDFTRFTTDPGADGENRDPAWLRGEFPGHIGPFRLEKLIKDGGMGVVFLASQTEPIERRVAIKFIKRTIDSPEARHRMKVECRSLAKFNHPNIAGFIDCGFYERIPYLVMEFVDGKGIFQYCHPAGSEPGGARAPGPGLRERLEIFLQACDGLWHAHQRGVIHRDISATNVMVTEIDGKPMAKLIDFGLSVLTERGADAPGSGTLMGTVAYMSPEQLREPHHAVDFRSDVYSMGVLLFELITGERPYAVTSERDALSTYSTLARPIAPSTKVEDATRKLTKAEAADRGRLRELRRLEKALRGDLDAIVVKAMELNPENRYGSVRDLADDLRAHLAGRPLLIARRSGPVVRVRKFLRRNWAACTAATLAVVFLAAAAAISTRAAIKETGLNTELRKANVDLAERTRGEEAKRRDRDAALRRLHTAQASSYAAQIRGLPDLLARGEVPSVRQTLLGTALSDKSKAIERGWEWNHLLARIEASTTVLGLSRRGFVDVLDAGSRICGVSGDGSVWFWSTDGTFVRTNRLHKEPVLAAWAGPEHKYCQTLDASGLIVRWAVEDGKRLGTVQLPPRVGELRNAVTAFSPDGTHLCLYRPGAKELLLVPTEPERKGEPVTPVPLPPTPVNLCLSWAKEGLACVVRVARDEDLRTGALQLLEWKTEAGGNGSLAPRNTKVLLGDLPLPQALTHAAGRFLLLYPTAAALFRCAGPPVRRVDLDSIAVLKCPGPWLGSAALSADGKRVVTGGSADDRTVRVWNAETGDFEGRFAGGPDDLGVRLGHDREITKVVFAGAGILSASADGTIRKWDANATRYAQRLVPPGTGTGKKSARLRSDMSWVRFLKNGSELVAVFSHEPWLVIWSTGKREKREPDFRLGRDQAAELLPDGYELVFAGASEDGTRMAFVRRHAKLKQYELVIGHFNYGKLSLKRIWGITSGRVQDLAVSNDGRKVALSAVEEADHPNGRLLLWQLGADEPGPGEPLSDSAGCLDDLAFDANSTRLAGCGKGLRVWDLQGQRPSRFYHVAGGDLRSPAFSPDGTRVVAGVGKPVGDLVEPAGLVLVNLGTGDWVPFGKQEASVVHGIAWNPSGTRIATAEHDMVRIWSVGDDCRLVLTLRDTAGFVDTIDWSHDGEWVATGCPPEGAAYLFGGPAHDDREGHFFLRELQRAHPIREHLGVHWQSVPEHRRFEKQYERFLRINGDDPGTVAEWAWKHLLPEDDPDAGKSAREEPGDRAWQERWAPCRSAVERAARNWDEDVEIRLLLGIAQYRNKQWPDAIATLKKIPAPRRDPAQRTPRSLTGEDDLAVIGTLYLAMACRHNGQEGDALQHLEVAGQLLRERGRQKQGIVVPADERIAPRAGAAVERARKEARTVFPEKAIGE
jgi:serine/threonine protein kinase/WD40 repeat protein